MEIIDDYRTEGNSYLQNLDFMKYIDELENTPSKTINGHSENCPNYLNSNQNSASRQDISKFTPTSYISHKNMQITRNAGSDLNGSNYLKSSTKSKTNNSNEFIDEGTKRNNVLATSKSNTKSNVRVSKVPIYDKIVEVSYKYNGLDEIYIERCFKMYQQYMQKSMDKASSAGSNGHSRNFSAINILLMENLTSLDVSHNNLEHCPISTWAGLLNAQPFPLLMSVDLSHNSMGCGDDSNASDHMKETHDSKICTTTLPASVLNGCEYLANLIEINLSYNKITV